MNETTTGTRPKMVVGALVALVAVLALLAAAMANHTGIEHWW